MEENNKTQTEKAKINKKQDKKKGKSAGYYFFKVLKSFTKHKFLFTTYIIVAFLAAFLAFFSPILYGKMTVAITSFEVNDIYYFLALFIGLRLVLNLLHFLWNVIFFKMLYKTQTKFVSDTLTEVTKIKTATFDKEGTGNFMQRMNGDVYTLTSTVPDVIDTIFNLLQRVSFLVYFFYLNIYVGILSLTYLMLHILVNRSKNIRATKYRKQMRKNGSKQSSVSNEIIRGVRDIKVLNARENRVSDFSRMLVGFQDYKYEFRVGNDIYKRVLAVLWFVFFGSFVVLSIYLINNNLLSMASFLILFFALGKVEGISWDYSHAKDQFSRIKVSGERVYDIYEESIFPKDKFGEKKVNSVKGEVEFVDVDFKYNKEKGNVFNKFNLKIKAGEMVGIVGESGGGKSTLLNLLTKSYDIESGKILIDGKNINNLDEDSLCGAISYVSQSPYIFNQTIKENMQIANPNLSIEEIESACKLANIHDFVVSTEKGYDTKVGENGVQLSGGQKQRLAIARALVNRNKIILLDEATSALDNESQQKIKKAISDVAKDHTFIIVAHRLTTVKDCDRIIMIKEGKIVADGKHEKLLAGSKDYQKLYKSGKQL